MANDLIKDVYIIKHPQKNRVQRVSGLATTWKPQSDVHGESLKALCPFLTPCPMSLSHLAAPGLYPFIINQ